MRLKIHPKVYADVEEIMVYYEQSATAKLADEFYEEFRRTMLEAARNPASFSIRAADLRRANLRRFPYHILFRIVGDTVRVLVVRHHRRHPEIGIERL